MTPLSRQGGRFEGVRPNRYGTVLILDVRSKEGLEPNYYVVPSDAHQIARDLSCRAATGFRRFFGLYSPFRIPRPFIKLPNDLVNARYVAERITPAERDFLLKSGFPVDEILDQIAARYAGEEHRLEVERKRIAEEARLVNREPAYSHDRRRADESSFSEDLPDLSATVAGRDFDPLQHVGAHTREPAAQ